MEFFQYGSKETDYLKSKDKRLAEAIERIGPVQREIIPDLFAGLVNSIVGQQISTKAMVTIWNRIKDLFITVTPESILSRSAEELQKCGITMKKAVYIRNIALDIVNGNFNINELHGLPDDEVCKKLSSLNGIGLWTAEMLMTFSMQRPDILSWDDLAIRRGIMMLYKHKQLDKQRFARYKKRYSPYCSVASLYLWEISMGK
jgi:DNA-3-methyladenine glycosylase II